MHQYQVIVETKTGILFATDWVTGLDKAIPLAMLLAARFEEPTYRITVLHRMMDITAQDWGSFVMGDTSGR